MRKNPFLFLGVVCAAVVLVGLLLVYTAGSSGRSSVSSSTPATTEPDAGLPTSRKAPAGFGEYHSATYHFSLFYPQSLSPKEYKEPGTALTVVFEDPFSDSGFQVFVVPYGEKKITPERFKLDVPSGVMASSTNVTLDGVAATTFYSRNQTMGDTYEVWFIYHGFLYEVTTYKELDTQLNEIMKTWKFL